MNLKSLLFVSLLFICTITAHAQSTAPAETATKTWSVGVNAGLMSPYSIIFLPNKAYKLELNAGYGLLVKKQFGKRLGLELSYQGGSVSSRLKQYSSGTSRRSFDSEIAYTTTLNGVVNLADFHPFQKQITLYAKTGLGVSAYAPAYTTGTGQEIDLKNKAGKNEDKTYFHALTIPVGIGFRTKVARDLSASANYSVLILTRDNLDGPTYKGSDRYSYASLGLEYSF